MSAQFVIRQAETRDSETVALLVSSLLDELSDGRGATDEESIREITGELLQNGLVTAWLAEDEGDRPIGLITVNECAAIYAGGRFGEISELYIAPAHRSSGLGRRLIEAARDFGLAKGWGRLEVGAPGLPRWQRTVDFYQRRGFVMVGPRLKLLLG